MRKKLGGGGGEEGGTTNEKKQQQCVRKREMLANVHATLCYVLGTSKRKKKKKKTWQKLEKTCLTEEALAPIGGSRSKYFFFSLVTHAAAAAQCIESIIIVRFNKVSRIRMHPHRREKRWLRAHTHTHTAKAKGRTAARLLSFLKVCSRT